MLVYMLVGYIWHFLGTGYRLVLGLKTPQMPVLLVLIFDYGERKRINRQFFFTS